jgi:hypothetical protein
MAYEESNQWLFTDAEVLSSPSILDGIDPAEERCRRAKGVNFILQVGMLLKLPQLTLAVASIFFHRLYMRKSLYVDNPVKELGALSYHHYVRPSISQSTSTTSPSSTALPPPSQWKLPRSKSHMNLKAKDCSLTFQSLEQNIAATALFLATKTEENCRKTKEIVIAVAKVAQKDTKLVIDEQSKEYWRWRDNILLYEEMMLELLTFDVVLKSPHGHLVSMLQTLQIEDNKHIRNVSWAFLNDSLMTTICLRMKSTDITIASIYFAVKFYNETIADDDNDRPWWEQLGGDADQIVKAIGIMHDFWSDNPLKLPDKPYASADYGSSPEALEETRRKTGSDGGYSGEDNRSEPEIFSHNGNGTGNGTQNGSVKRKSPDDGEEGEAEVEEPASKKARIQDTQETLDTQETQGTLDTKAEVKPEKTKVGEGDLQIEEGEANTEEGEVE